MRALLLTACLLAGSFLTATPALACINDREVQREEDEFRRGYEQDEARPAEDEDSLLYMALTALGSFGVGGAAWKALQGAAIAAA